jgi:hypothetical protein
MKKVIVIISLIIIYYLGLIFCTEGKVLKSNTPINAGRLIKLTIDDNDYEAFNNLFSKGRKGIITKEDFNEFNNITTAGSSHRLYDIITFQNGEMLLVRLTPEKINREYQVEDVIRIPDEMKQFFGDK